MSRPAAKRKASAAAAPAPRQPPPPQPPVAAEPFHALNLVNVGAEPPDSLYQQLSLGGLHRVGDRDTYRGLQDADGLQGGQAKLSLGLHAQADVYSRGWLTYTDGSPQHLTRCISFQPVSATAVQDEVVLFDVVAAKHGASASSAYVMVPVKFLLQAPRGALLDVRALGRAPGWVLCRQRAHPQQLSAILGTQADIPADHEMVQ